jgi:hypothetical protein
VEPSENTLTPLADKSDFILLAEALSFLYVVSKTMTPRDAGWKSLQISIQRVKELFHRHS